MSRPAKQGSSASQVGQFKIWGADMDRKWILLALVFILIGSVSAADLENRDFDGYFSMDVPKGANFTNSSINITENATDDVIVTYMGDRLEITYMNAQFLFENQSSEYFEVVFELLYPGFEIYHSSSDENMTLFEAVDEDWVAYPVVGIADGNRMVFVIGEDLNLVKEMGASIKFD